MVELDPGRIAAAVGGGALIGLAASIWLLALGRVAGISGIFAGVLPGGDARGDEWSLRVAFLAGMIATGFVLKVATPSVFGPNPDAPGASGSTGRDLALMATAGLLVGIGTRTSSGCTSGHGVCGLSRGSARSLVATMTFMGAAMMTVYARRALGWP